MGHALQFKKIEKEIEELKVENYSQTKVLKGKYNVLDHKQKLQAIELTTKTQQKGKQNDLTR
jgi:hypothetical protein